eukprot:scaffold8947_cov113-Isochrysis_galbana.AAC.2
MAGSDAPSLSGFRDGRALKVLLLARDLPRGTPRELEESASIAWDQMFERQEGMDVMEVARALTRAYVQKQGDQAGIDVRTASKERGADNAMKFKELLAAARVRVKNREGLPHDEASCVHICENYLGPYEEAVRDAAVGATYIPKSKRVAGGLIGQCAPIFDCPFVFGAHFLAMPSFCEPAAAGQRQLRGTASHSPKRNRQQFATFRRGDILVKNMEVCEEDDPSAMSVGGAPDKKAVVARVIYIPASSGSGGKANQAAMPQVAATVRA